MREEPRVQQVAHPTPRYESVLIRVNPWFDNPRSCGGFTLIELTVSVGLLVVVLLIASLIFRVSIESHRIATANAEIMQKLRAITQQLNADFAGLRKNGEIAVAWVARKVNTTYPAGDPRADLDIDDPDGYVRMDRIMFFTEGDFQAYSSYGVPSNGSNPPVPVRGNLARVSYQLAQDASGTDPNDQIRSKRMLARTQHILTAQGGLDPFPPSTLTGPPPWQDWHNRYEYDVISLDAWKYLIPQDKVNIISVIMGLTLQVDTIVPTVAPALRGTRIDLRDSATIHMLLCEGVGEFCIQGWSDAERRWVPAVNPNGDSSYADSDFYPAGPTPDPSEVVGVLYPYPATGWLRINGSLKSYPRQEISEAYFNRIPGLGRALKFTFTLYDSKGVLPKGRTFTHIVYLDD